MCVARRRDMRRFIGSSNSMAVTVRVLEIYMDRYLDENLMRHELAMRLPHKPYEVTTKNRRRMGTQRGWNIFNRQ